MYNIILKDRKVISINATEVDWEDNNKAILFYDKFNDMVARINMDDIIGWIKADNMVKGDDDENLKAIVPRPKCALCEYAKLMMQEQPYELYKELKIMEENK